jgi:hypothetical protein
MQRDLLTSLEHLPGVTAAGFSNFLPASNATIRYQMRLQDVARDETASRSEQLTVGERSVTSAYFNALGARMAAGTSCPDIAAVDMNTPKAIVNRRFADTFAGGKNVVGKYLRWVDQAMAPIEVVGMVNDIREDNLRTAAVPYVYLCIAGGNWPDPEYVVRTSGDARAIIPAIRSAVHAVDPSRAVFGIMPLADNVDATLGQTRLQTRMVAAFGVVAVALAVVGLYGLVALAVATRRREIGIRLALGAEPRRVVRELATRVAWLVAGGTLAGIAMTVIAQRQLRAVVFGVAPLDPLTIGTAVLSLIVASAIATLVPALRAAAIDPVGAIRDS